MKLFLTLLFLRLPQRVIKVKIYAAKPNCCFINTLIISNQLIIGAMTATFHCTSFIKAMFYQLEPELLTTL
jgi:hypothetical protein